MALKLSNAPEIFRNFAEICLWRLAGLSKHADRAERGRFGEWSARRFLIRKGYYILAQNWRNPRDLRDEIDLIYKDCEVLVFVEVWERDASAQVSGYHSVSSQKKKSLLKSFKVYLNLRKERPDHFRFDIIEIDLRVDGMNKLEIFHHENVALFPSRFH